jgi:hypothetical protein
VDRACGTNGRREKSVQGFGGKAVAKRPNGRPRRRWKDGIRVEIRKIGLGVDWV